MIEDFDTAIVYQNGKELKAWQAIAAYMEFFEENKDEIPLIPEKYSAPEGRKVVDWILVIRRIARRCKKKSTK